MFKDKPERKHIQGLFTCWLLQQVKPSNWRCLNCCPKGSIEKHIDQPNISQNWKWSLASSYLGYFSKFGEGINPMICCISVSYTSSKWCRISQLSAIPQDGAPKIAKLAYKWPNYGLWWVQL